jgi:hypothetical protein
LWFNATTVQVEKFFEIYGKILGAVDSEIDLIPLEDTREHLALLRLVGKLSSSFHVQPKPGGENCQVHSNHTLGE